MDKKETTQALRAAIKENSVRIRQLKMVRALPGQPGWQGSGMGCDLEQRKGLATLLCLARARMRGRRHVVVLPRVILLPPGGTKTYGSVRYVANQAELDKLCDEEIAARFPGALLEAPLDYFRAPWRVQPSNRPSLLARIRAFFRRRTVRAFTGGA